MCRRPIELRRLTDDELARVGEIDRSERIDALIVQHGTRLERRSGRFDAAPWRTAGHGEHSVAEQRAFLEGLAGRGAVALGAFDADRLVAIGAVLPHLRPGMAQLAFLHVSAAYRGQAIGGRLSEALEQVALESGDREIVVSATPSANTVRFYRRRGFRPMAEPLPELHAVEPEDAHLHKPLRT